MFNNGAVEFCEIVNGNESRDFGRNIPFSDYIYKEQKPENYVSILTFGADENADYAVNTSAVNSAIDFVNKSGGGTVLVPHGTFICSNIVLKSNVTLFIEGTLKCIDYDTNKACQSKLAGDNTYFVHSRTSGGFITANGERNISICGGGKIYGNGESYCEAPRYTQNLLPLEKWHLKSYIMSFRYRIRYEKQNSGRVNLIELSDCENIDIHNIELFESARWTCNLFCCDSISIKDVVINNNYHVANSDGFDLSCCSNAVIDHCYICTGDDALCIKADGDRNIENITIRNCKAMSLANCFKIGTTVYRNVKNILVENCEFFMDNTTGGYAGISIQSDCGGNVSDVTVRNIKMNGVTSCFLVWLGNRNGITPGSMENIKLENIKAENISLPSAITGTNHEDTVYKVKNVEIKNVETIYRDSAEEIYIRDGGVGYESMLEYPEITRICSIYTNSHEQSPYWELPVYGLYVRDAENVRLDNFSCVPRKCNKREMTNI